jgi:hypothetical protein
MDDFATANQHAQKALDAVSTMKSQIAQGGYDNSFKDWIRSLDDSARSNLAWTKSMVAWQQEQLQRALLRRPQHHEQTNILNGSSAQTWQSVVGRGRAQDKNLLSSAKK